MLKSLTFTLHGLISESGEEGVYKILDQFLANHNILREMGLYPSWVGPICASDNFHIFIELGWSEGRLGSPFKYNSS